MDDLMHISPEFRYSYEEPTANDVIYCTSSVGLNSNALFYHFLHFALKAKCKTFALTSYCTKEEITAVSKRCGINLDDYVENEMLDMVSVSGIDEVMPDTGVMCNGEKCDWFDNITLPPSGLHSFSTCAETLLNRVQNASNREQCAVVLVDDIRSLSPSPSLLLRRIRALRDTLEDSYKSFTLLLFHPCGLDDSHSLYHALVSLSDVQYLLLPLSTGHSTAVDGFDCASAHLWKEFPIHPNPKTREDLRRLDQIVGSWKRLCCLLA